MNGIDGCSDICGQPFSLAAGMERACLRCWLAGQSSPMDACDTFTSEHGMAGKKSGLGDILIDLPSWWTAMRLLAYLRESRTLTDEERAAARQACFEYLLKADDWMAV